MWTYIPCYCSFNCVGGDGASPPKIHEPFGWKSLVGVRGIELGSNQRFHPVRIGARRACCFLAYDPANPNMFSVNDPSSIMSLLSRLWIQEPTFVLRARKNSTINFQECLGTWVRHCLAVAPSGMTNQRASLSECRRASLSECQGGFSCWGRCVSDPIRLMVSFWSLA